MKRGGGTTGERSRDRRLTNDIRLALRDERSGKVRSPIGSRQTAEDAADSVVSADVKVGGGGQFRDR